MKKKFLPYKGYPETMAVKFMHDWTHSFSKDKVTNQKWQNCANTMWRLFFFNDETCLMKELALLFNVFVICHHVHSLGVHHCLLIPKINKNLALFTISKPELASNSSFPLQIWGNFWLWTTLIEYMYTQRRFWSPRLWNVCPPSNALRGRMRVPSFFGKGVFWGVCLGKVSRKKTPGKGVFLYIKNNNNNG